MKAKINGQHFGFVDRNLFVSKSVGIYECEFVFDETWVGWNKTAVFEGSGSTIEVVVVDDKAQVPWEVIKDNGLLKIGVYGTLDEKIRPTIWSEQATVKLGTPTGSIGTEPTPSIYAQILDVANEAKETADNAELVADEAYERAVTAQNSAEASARAAHDSAESASSSASSASISATNATNSASEAHGYEQNAKEHADDAEDAADRAEQSAAVSGYMFFYIDENGDLIYQRTSNVQVDFALIDGDLYVGAEG